MPLIISWPFINLDRAWLDRISWILSIKITFFFIFIFILNIASGGIVFYLNNIRCIIRVLSSGIVETFIIKDKEICLGLASGYNRNRRILDINPSECLKEINFNFLNKRSEYKSLELDSDRFIGGVTCKKIKTIIISWKCNLRLNKKFSFLFI